MTLGLVGRKCGMTRIFTEDESIPVTVIEVQPNRVVQIKNLEKDGYCAIQVTFGKKRSSRLSKPEIGHFAKAKVEAGLGLWEHRLEQTEIAELKIGSEFGVDLFAEGAKVDVTGQSKGKGFAGVIKRYHFAAQDATHGNSLSHRAPGSIGQRQTPGRVFKGKKMAGHLGDARRTTQNLVVARIDKERNLIFIKGAVPGSIGGNVLIKPMVKIKRGKDGA